MSPAKKRGSINLTALGSAAVVAVYAAGYLRTKPAAQRFERSDSERRPVPPAAALTPIDAGKLIDPVLADTLRAWAAPAPKKAKQKPAAIVVDTSSPSPGPASPPTDSTTPSPAPAPAPPA